MELTLRAGSIPALGTILTGSIWHFVGITLTSWMSLGEHWANEGSLWTEVVPLRGAERLSCEAGGVGARIDTGTPRSQPPVPH